MPDEKTPRHIHTNRSAKADYLACKEILSGSRIKAETTCVERSAKADYLASMAFLCGGLYDAETICKVLVEEDLMDLVYESSFVKQLIQQGIEEGIQQGIEEGIQQGIEEGIQQGIEQRERGYAIKNIITVLEIRFDLHESENLSARLATITDLQRLKQLHRAAIQVSSLEAFEQVLDA